MIQCQQTEGFLVPTPFVAGDEAACSCKLQHGSLACRRPALRPAELHGSCSDALEEFAVTEALRGGLVVVLRHGLGHLARVPQPLRSGDVVFRLQLAEHFVKILRLAEIAVD